MFFRILLLTLSLVVYGFSQTGKLVGSVTDFETGEPLVGANILLDGTYLGGATDINGEFIILNIPPGTYNIKGLYVGYSDLVVENVQISSNLTTQISLKLRPDSFESDVITIVAERPLINKNITNSTSVITSADIENFPARTVTNIVAQEAGIVQQGNNLFVRGSRNDAVAYYVDGVLVNNPLSGGSQTSLISNAIEEVQFQAGGYTAEFSGANGGIVSSTSKVGGENYKFNVELISDNFVARGENYFGGNSFGYSEYIFTAGGPVIPSFKKLRFFIAANNSYQDTPPGFYKSINLPELRDPTVNNEKTIDLVYPKGQRANAWQNTYNIQGNLTYNLSPVTLRLNTSMRFSEGENGKGITNFAARDRTSINESQRITSSLKLTHVINSKSFYDVIVNYFNDFTIEQMDPIFKHNTFAYGDSIQNANLGYVLDGDGDPTNTFKAYGFALLESSRPNFGYAKQRVELLGGKLNFLFQAGKHHEFKFGAEANTYTIRRYAVGARNIALNARAVADGELYDIYNGVNNYGYDPVGNLAESGIEAPKKPVYAGAYVQDKLEYEDLVLTAGIRLDYIDIDDFRFKNPNNIKFDNNDIIDLSETVNIDPYIFLSPRLGFSFPVTDKTIFHAQFGKFVQQSKLRDSYLGLANASTVIKGGLAYSNPIGFGLKPERTTQYDIGFKQQLGENFSFDITAYYKDIKDQIQLRQVFAEPGAAHGSYYAFVNGDFATTKGIDVKLNLRRTNRLQGSVNYSFASARGTGSNPSSAFRQIWGRPTAEPFFPQQVSDVTFNQDHVGSVNLDYRFADNDGMEILGSKPLSQMGFNLLFRFNSGNKYTKADGFGRWPRPSEALNSSSTPWQNTLDLRVDKTFKLGPLSANVYLWVTNLLNRKNVQAVFIQSGNVEDSGYLDAEGQARLETYQKAGTDNLGRSYADIYRELISAIGYTDTAFGTTSSGGGGSYASMFGPPRQVRFGLRLNF
jgi:outer membrane receptor protein involved in Fe transport